MAKAVAVWLLLMFRGSMLAKMRRFQAVLLDLGHSANVTPSALGVKSQRKVIKLKCVWRAKSAGQRWSEVLLLDHERPIPRTLRTAKCHPDLRNEVRTTENLWRCGLESTSVVNSTSFYLNSHLKWPQHLKYNEFRGYFSLRCWDLRSWSTGPPVDSKRLQLGSTKMYRCSCCHGATASSRKRRVATSFPSHQHNQMALCICTHEIKFLPYCRYYFTKMHRATSPNVAWQDEQLLRMNPLLTQKPK